jgi:CPA2 family monovalent cation:H+ antiporter-2
MLKHHAIVVGYGRVGCMVAEALEEAGMPYLVVEQAHHVVQDLRQQGVAALFGDATHAHLMEEAGLAEARLLIVAIPSPLEARMIVSYARTVRPDLRIVARTHTMEEQAFLMGHGASQVVYGETELAQAMIRHALEHQEDLEPRELRAGDQA